MSGPIPRSLHILAALASAFICSPESIATTSQVRVFCGTQQWEPLIAEASSRTTVPQEWIRAVMLAESAACAVTDGVPTTSPAGARGLMQIMPATWERIRDRLGLGTDPYDPHDNIVAGAALLRDLCQRYGLPACIAAYHAGTRRFEEYVQDSRPLPEATLDYVARVQRWLAKTNTPLAMTKPEVERASNSPFASLDSSERRSGTVVVGQERGPFVRLTRRGQHSDRPIGGDADVQSR